METFKYRGYFGILYMIITSNCKYSFCCCVKVEILYVNI